MNVNTENRWVDLNAGLGITLNLFLILIISTDTQLPGSGYKKMLILIALYHMSFSSVHCSVEVNCLYDGQGWLCFSERMRHFGFWESYWATVLYAFMCSQSLSLFAVHCCYRYVSITGNYRFIFNRWYCIVMVAIVSVIFGAAYAIAIGVFMKPTPVRASLSKDLLATEYNIDVETLGYVGSYFQFTDEAGVSRYHLRHIVGTGICSLVILVAYSATCIIGVRLYIFVRNGSYTSTARRLHMQLLRLLLAQGMAPLITDFTPLAIALSGGVFGLFPPHSSMYMPIIVSTYPAIDAIMIILLFKAYRLRALYYIKRCFCFWKHHDDPAHVVSLKSMSVSRVIGYTAKPATDGTTSRNTEKETTE